MVIRVIAPRTAGDVDSVHLVVKVYGVHIEMSASPRLERTRRSLFFPAAYLFTGGLGLLLAPGLALRLLLSNGTYGEPMTRYLGVVTLGLAAIVIQTIRLRLTLLYTTLIWVRVFFCVCYAALAVQTHDPLFGVMLALVGSGVVGTSVTYFSERRTA